MRPCFWCAEVFNAGLHWRGLLYLRYYFIYVIILFTLLFYLRYYFIYVIILFTLLFYLRYYFIYVIILFTLLFYLRYYFIYVYLNYFILIRYFFFVCRHASPVALWRPPGEARLTYWKPLLYGFYYFTSCPVGLLCLNWRVSAAARSKIERYVKIALRLRRAAPGTLLRHSAVARWKCFHWLDWQRSAAATATQP